MPYKTLRRKQRIRKNEVNAEAKKWRKKKQNINWKNMKILDKELQVRDIRAINFVGLFNLKETQETAIGGFFNRD